MTQSTVRWSRVLLCFVAALCAAGIAAQALAARPSGASAITEHVLRHSGTIVLAMTAAVVMARLPVPTWRRLAIYLGAGSLVLLVLVLVAGHEAKGAQRWLSVGPLGTLQPSEIAKPALITVLAVYLASRDRDIQTLGAVLGSLLVVVPPVLLIALQPDLGTALVLLGIWLAMLFAAGTPARYLAAIVVVGAILFAGLWQTSYIKPYQKDRLTVFLRNDADPAAEAYHITQSVHAIRRGGMTGWHGPVDPADRVPERDTDFIFTVIAENGGFVASAALLLLYAGLFITAWTVIDGQPTGYGRLMAMGLLAMWAIHTFVNIGMTMRLCPIVGVPLPFISRGGTAMLVNLAAAGFFSALDARRRTSE